MFSFSQHGGSRFPLCIYFSDVYTQNIRLRKVRTVFISFSRTSTCVCSKLLKQTKIIPRFQSPEKLHTPSAVSPPSDNQLRRRCEELCCPSDKRKTKQRKPSTFQIHVVRILLRFLKLLDLAFFFAELHHLQGENNHLRKPTCITKSTKLAHA